MILETGELVTYDNGRRASWLAMLAGADFTKTSTGKITPPATLPVTLVTLTAVTLAEVLATSDVPPGVVNVLTGPGAELAPVSAGDMDVNAIDLTGADAGAGDDLDRHAAANLKRILRAPDAEPDWTAEPGLARMSAFLETKTV